MLAMADDRPVLRLAHSCDPDDAAMWWPITGMLEPGLSGRAVTEPEIGTGRFRFAAVPEDIQVLNRRAAEAGDLEITALSLFGWAMVADRYALTSCGSSLGEGYGPKVVVRAGSAMDLAALRRLARSGELVVAVPGKRTTAYLVLCLALGVEPSAVELPFDRVIGAVGSAGLEGPHAGVVIHEGQLTFADAGLEQALDLGAWWQEETGLPLPLGVNAVRRDLEDRFGPGTLAEVSGTLRRSIEHALAHRDRSIDYSLQFALQSEGGVHVSRERVDRYLGMYVTPLTVSLGERGRRAIELLLSRAVEAGRLVGLPEVVIVGE